MQKYLFFSFLFSSITFTSSAYAGGTERFVIESTNDFLAGDLEGTTVHSSAHVTVGAEYTRMNLADTELAYAMVRGSDGAIYIGTGSQGKIIKVVNDRAEVFAQTGQLLVSSLTFGENGILYAGTLPEGRIFSIDQNGQSTELIKLPDTNHIWALLWDSRQQKLLAATGPEGRIYAIDRRARAEVLWDTEDAHIMCMSFDENGTLLAGTSDRALVVRIRNTNQVEVIHDFPGNEITSISVRHRMIVVAANEVSQTTPAAASTTPSPNASRSRPRSGKGRVFRIEPNGRVERLASEDETHFTSVEIAEDGAVFAGLGKNGRILRIAPDRTTSIWVDVEERQVLATDLSHNPPIFITGDSAALYRIQPGNARNPQWTSAVLDAGQRAEWGRLLTRATGSFVVESRSGQTDHPDITWSPWARTSQNSEIESPAARYVQLRFRLSQSTILRGMTLYYLPMNQRPVLLSVGIQAPQTENAQANTQRRSRPSSTTIKLNWRIENPDNDEIRYRLRYRRENETLWRSLLRSDVVLTANTYDWDTTTMADGWYVIEVEASDELSNPEDRTLISTMASDPILVDNHAPEIVDLNFQRGHFKGRAIDLVGPISRLEIAIDGGVFRDIFPVDSIFDHREELFDIVLPGLSANAHIISVRATDTNHHQVIQEMTFTP